MTAWMKERDRLVQQTMAFVQGVAAQRPVRIDSAESKAPEPVVPLFAAKPFEVAKRPDAVKPAEAIKPADDFKLFEAANPFEVAKPFEATKPAEPALKTPTSDASLVEAEALMSLIAKSLPSLRSEPLAPFAPVTAAAEPSTPSSVAKLASTPAVADQPSLSVAVTPSPLRSNAPVYVPVPKRMDHFALPQRDMIAHCVANFRAFQLRMIRERENNYATVQAKIRASLGNDSPA